MSQDFTSGDGELLFYNWKTGEKIRNGLTEKLNVIRHIKGLIDSGYTFAIKKRFLLTTYYSARERNDPRLLKITWDEDYEEVQLIPLSTT